MVVICTVLSPLMTVFGTIFEVLVLKFYIIVVNRFAYRYQALVQ